MTVTAKDINGNEIKVGDTVERVGGGDDLLVQRGNKYVVKKIRNRMKSWLFFVGVSDDYLSTNFKVIPSKKKPFTKSDLKDGMIVKYRNGWIRFVSGDSLYKVNEDFIGLGSYLKSYNNYLEHDNDEDLDIVKVFSSADLENPIWEREEAPTREQLRIKELEEGIAKMQEELNKLL